MVFISFSEIITKLIENGVNIFRFNMKHNVPEWHIERINRVQKVANSLQVTTGILIDLQGPEIRIETPNGEDISIDEDDKISFGVSFDQGSVLEKFVRIAHTSVIESLLVGDKFSIDDGFLSFEVIEKPNSTLLIAKSAQKGVIKHRKGLNLSGIDVDLPSLIDEDLDKLDIAATSKVDFIALSFTRSKQDIEILQNEIKKRDIQAKIIAKIESQKGLDNIDEIIDVADGVMIARGDLGIEVPIEKLTYIQKELIKKCRTHSKPVIVATQMLQSMVRNPLPTRAEAADVSNAILDGTDCIMLSEETATGNYPVKAVDCMRKICKFNESHKELADFVPESPDQSHAIVKAALSMFQNNSGIKIDKVLVFTETGYTARVLASYRPNIPVVAISDNKKTVENLTLTFGVFSYLMSFPTGNFTFPNNLTFDLLRAGVLKEGDTILIIHGKQWKDPGNTNALVVMGV